MTDHVLGDVYRDELVPVVYGNRVPNELRADRGRPRPGLDDSLLAGAVHQLDLFEQLLVDERPLLDASRHIERPLLSALAPATAAHDVLVALLLAPSRFAAFGLSPRRDRRTPA